MEMRALIFAVSAVILDGCVPNANDAAALSQTFERGFITAPWQTTLSKKPCLSRIAGVSDTCLNKIDTSKKYPVIVFMHGCGGLNLRNLESFRNVAITVSPDSYARPNRKAVCANNANKKDIMALRFAEAKHTAEQLKKFPWADTTKIILAGTSEGASTTALYSGNEFAGRIILGWVCAARDPWWVGISGPKNTPVLAVVGERDRFYKNDIDQSGHHCGEHFGSRPKSRSIQIKEGQHNIVWRPITREAIKTFVEEVTR